MTMNFTTFCDNKGCHKEMSPVVDPETMKCYCTECGKELGENTVSIFMRRQMAANGMTKRNEKKKLAWSVRCDKCGREGPPQLDKEGAKLICSYCEEPLDNISKPFAQSILVNLRAQRRAGQ
jgi:hypothetical protein